MLTATSDQDLSSLAAGYACLSAEAWLEGESPAIARVRTQIARIAPYFRFVMLTGERDCGEGYVARALHQLSPIKNRPFYTVTPEDAALRLLNDGSLDSLSGEGLLYFPYIESFPPSVNEALLYMVRKHRNRALRVVAFAQLQLKRTMNCVTFPPALAGSFAGLRIRVPAVRQRLEDIPGLLAHMMSNLREQQGSLPCRLTISLLDEAKKRPWLGNLIELETVAERLVRRAGEIPLSAEDLDAVMGVQGQPELLDLNRVIQQHILKVFRLCNGDMQHAAQVLGISISSLYRSLKCDTP